VKRKAAAATKRSEERARVRLDVDERRAMLVDLGLSEFGTRSYGEVSIDLIAKTAGISKGLLYHYFPTKRAYYLACVREAARRLLVQLGAFPPDLSPFERLLWGIDAYLEYVRARGRAYATLMRNAVGLDPEIGAVVDDTRATLLQAVTGDLVALFPAANGGIPELLRLSLHGWIGMAEAMSIAWVEACVDADTKKGAPPPPTATAIREVLAKTLVTLVDRSLQR
jgi:AcrR family transcriptional regulator